MYSLLLLFIKPSVAVSHELTFCLILTTWWVTLDYFCFFSRVFFLQFFKNRYYRLCIGPSDHRFICASIPRWSGGESFLNWSWYICAYIKLFDDFKYETCSWKSPDFGSVIQPGEKLSGLVKDEAFAVFFSHRKSINR